MSNQKKKQSFIEDAVDDIIGCAANFGMKAKYQEGLEEVITKYLKQSFKNGTSAGYGKAKRETKGVSGTEGQQ